MEVGRKAYSHRVHPESQAKDGTIHLLCVQVVDNQVVMVRTKEKEGYFGLQVGAINHPKLQNVSAAGLYD